MIGKVMTLLVAFLVGVLPALPAAAQDAAGDLVGSPAPVFSLADDGGRLVDYDDAYYGKHHLVVTFFPAAFTPV